MGMGDGGWGMGVRDGGWGMRGQRPAPKETEGRRSVGAVDGECEAQGRRGRVGLAGAGGSSGIRHEGKYSFVRNSRVFILNLSRTNQDNCVGPRGLDRAIAAKLAAFLAKN